ncbi:MAG: hypothetical protein GY936_16470 [Ignavibacteriae bacterium]|nr:hypothetical protein [Ignavibacteriota bacterium]
MKKKLIILFVIIFTSIVQSQVGYVSIDDEIYNYLERMNTIGIIEDYNSFELPKTRSEITKHLIEITKKQINLDSIDKKKLDDFINEFELDIKNSTLESESFIPNGQLKYLLSDKEKYLYSYHDSNKVSVFVNLIGKLDYLSKNQSDPNYNSNSLVYRFGGEVRGSLFNRLGFSARTTNGSFSGNKKLAQSFGSLKYNYKFTNTTGSELGENFFDETESFLFLDFNYANFKIGNDRKLIGYGTHKLFLGDIAPRLEYFQLNLNYKSIHFSSFHGKLLGSNQSGYDSEYGSLNAITDKYLAYHRVNFAFSKHFNFSLGEMIIYSRRNLDISYINPFNFYKSSEHANQDRDNSMLFLDIQNNSIKGLKIFSSLLIDDIDFGKVGTGWYGNQTLLNIGVFSSLLYNYVPIDMELQYIRIDPFVFSHRIPDNNFTNLNFNMATNLQPNTSAGNLNLYYRPTHRININLGITYAVHGANAIDENDAIVNYGGDLLTGYRIGDKEEVYFLDGEKEIFRNIKIKTTYEPIKNWIFVLDINYFNNSLARSHFEKYFYTNFSLYTKI